MIFQTQMLFLETGQQQEVDWDSLEKAAAQGLINYGDSHLAGLIHDPVGANLVGDIVGVTATNVVASLYPHQKFDVESTMAQILGSLAGQAGMQRLLPKRVIIPAPANTEHNTIYSISPLLDAYAQAGWKSKAVEHYEQEQILLYSANQSQGASNQVGSQAQWNTANLFDQADSLSTIGDLQSVLSEDMSLANVYANTSSSAGSYPALTHFLWSHQDAWWDKALLAVTSGMALFGHSGGYQFFKDGMAPLNPLNAGVHALAANDPLLTDALTDLFPVDSVFKSLEERLTGRDPITDASVSPSQSDIGIALGSGGLGVFARGATLAGRTAIRALVGSEREMADLAEFASEARGDEIYYHTVTDFRSVRGLWDGVDISRLSDNARFNAGLYLSRNPNTTLEELAYHENFGVDTIKYSLDMNNAKILNLANSKVASEWGYLGGDDYTASKLIASRAKEQGYNVIRFNSERGEGQNIAVINDFDRLLTPRRIVAAGDYSSLGFDDPYKFSLY